MATYRNGSRIYAEHGPDGKCDGRWLVRIADGPATGYSLFERGEVKCWAGVSADGRCGYNGVICARDDPRVLALNIRDDAAPALSGYDRTPEATVSSHLWRFALPTDLALGEHRIRVRAIDDWLGEITQDAIYRLEARQP